MEKESFFTHDRTFYRTFFRLMAMVALQNLVAYSVNMADNIMLGRYSQSALSGAATVNQIFFLVQQATIAIGAGDMKRVRSDARSMSVIDICVGIVLGLILLAARQPLLSMYSLNERAMELAGQFMYILCIVMVGMSYQMPVSSGIIRGAGDARFSLILNLVSVWCIVMPLTFLAAFVWKWPAPAVVCVIQSDQIFKGLPIFLRFKSYKWIKKLTK